MTYLNCSTKTPKQLPCMAAAAQYLKRGWSIIPVSGKTRRPLLEWKPYQSRHPTEDEITEWWRTWPYAQVAVVTGAVSGLLVLDIDGPEAQDSLKGKPLPPTPCVRTSRGTHYYFAHPGGVCIGRPHPLPGFDIRADGNYVVAPPSIHPSGHQYEWVDGLSIDDIPLAPCPEWLVDLSRSKGGQKQARPVEEWRKLVKEGVKKGERNTTIASLAGHLLRKYVDPYVVLYLLLAWNRVACQPPLPEEEVITTVDSIAKREAKRREVARRDKSA